MNILPKSRIQNSISSINTWLIKYLYRSGDSQETLLLKKIWWIFNVGGFPFLLLMSFIMGDKEGIGVVIVNLIWVTALLLGLLIFHFYRKRIEEFALASQLGIVLLSSVKVYLLGGLLYAGAPIFIGLIGPFYALTLPGKKRAVLVFLLYMVLMMAATLLQPHNTANYLLAYHFLGFVIGAAMAFMALYYFTGQVDKLKLEEKQRMQEVDKFKTRFYTHITHEFRTPLTIILGMAEQIKNKPEEWQHEGLKMIKRNGRKLLNLTNQMLDLSKLEANAMPVNLIQDDVTFYLKYLVESFHSLAEAKNIRLLFSSIPQEIKMDFDQDKIQDILSNLLYNAIKFTPVGGTIEVLVSRENLPPGSTLILKVKDTGTGIPSVHLHKVFDRYFQAENNNEGLTEGTGLGLAITQELVKLLEGEITLDSSLGKGSTFTVTLPITNRAYNGQRLQSKVIAAASLPLEKSELSLHPQNGETNAKLVILVVEDNKDVIQYISSLLCVDYEIVVAGNGQEGFEKAVEIIPDLVISDVMMPMMDGFAFCEKLKSDLRTSHIPVILLTARADSESKMEGLKAGADVYLAKPFNREELFIRIEKLISLRKALQHRYQATISLQQRHDPVSSPILDKEDAFMQEVRQTLENHLSEEEFGIAELCRSLAMSRSQLYRKFAALTNTSVHRFIRKLRLVKAKELLLTTELNVSEVAYDTGFKNPSHFSRVYSEEFGVAPSRTRV